MLDQMSDIALHEGGLRLRDGHGEARELHPLWLRERCPCPDCRDSQTGQRLIDTWRLPVDLAVETILEAPAELSLRFSDGHVAPFTRAGLAAELAPPPDPLADVTLWDADLAEIPEADWPSVAADDFALHDMLEALRRYAFVVVRRTPVEMDGVAEVVARIGPMRRTNWGGIADVKAIASAYDLTMTTRALEPHTDNPYREPAPGYIFLHCLQNDADGGGSVIIDGARIAEELRATAPEAFATLTGIPACFVYRDEDAALEGRGPLIETDEAGRVRRLRLSNRTEAVEGFGRETLDAYYRARAKWAALVDDPRFRLEFKLGPGDLLIMDNHRLLHGRAAYRPGTGDRHMRQCYMDRDSVASRRAVLARRRAAA